MGCVGGVGGVGGLAVRKANCCRSLASWNFDEELRGKLLESMTCRGGPVSAGLSGLTGLAGRTGLTGLAGLAGRLAVVFHSGNLSFRWRM